MDSSRTTGGPPLPPEPPPAGPPLPPDPPPVDAAAPTRRVAAPPGSPLTDVVPETRQLPPHRGKVSRITDHVASLSTDIREWAELRIDLVKAEIQEKIDEVQASLKRKGIGLAFLAVAGVLALYGLGFLLGALAWGLAALTGSIWLGMLLTAALVFIVVGVLAWLGKKKLDEDKAIEAHAKVPHVEESRAAHSPPSRIHLQDLEAKKARAATT